MVILALRIVSISSWALLSHVCNLLLAAEERVLGVTKVFQVVEHLRLRRIQGALPIGPTPYEISILLC